MILKPVNRTAVGRLNYYAGSWIKFLKEQAIFVLYFVVLQPSLGLGHLI